MLRVSGVHERIAAVLHDVVEDTSVTLEALAAQGFAPEVLSAVDALTKRKGETRESAARRARLDPVARAVKRADVTENMDMTRLRTVRPEDMARLDQYRRVLEILDEAQ